MDDIETKEKGRIQKALLILVIGIIIGAGAFWTVNYYMTKTPTPVVSQVSQDQINALLAKVGKLVILPTGETPVVATINDAATLAKEQSFYDGAENGDVVIVYQKAAKAIIYSPSRNIIVNVGPVLLQNSTSTAPASTSTAQ